MNNRLTLTLITCLVPMAIQAHPLHVGPSFSHGLTHPFLGLDHILAMLAVGLWAVQLGKTAFWKLPATFLTSMLLGGFFGSYQISLPFLEAGILTSVILLGFLLMLAKPLPLFVSLIIVGISGLMHGYAHGLEIPVGHSGFSYGVGFFFATASLHGVGLMLPFLFQRSIPFTRWAGVGILMGSGFIILGF